MGKHIKKGSELFEAYELNTHELLEKVVCDANTAILIIEAAVNEAKGPKVLYANDAYNQLVFNSGDEQNKCPHFLYDYLVPEDIGNLATIISNLPIQEEASANFLAKADNHQQLVPFHIVPLSDINHCFKAILLTQQSEPSGSSTQQHGSTTVAATAQTQKTKEATRENLEKSHRDFPGHNLQSLLDSLPGIVFTCNSDLGWSRRSLSQGCLKLTGYAPEELLGTFNLTYNTLIDPDNLPQLTAAIATAIATQQVYTVEYRIRTKSGQLKWFLEQGNGIFNKQGQALGLEGFITDISQLKQAETQLRHDAFYDKLTGLPNRSLFMDRLEYCIKRVKRHPDQIFAVLFLDLDRFKVVNDSLGHAAGDQLLVEIAERLTACVRETDTLARLGGDEFTVLLEGIKDLSDALIVCGRIQESLNCPFNLNGREVLITVSTGVALSTMGYDDPEQLLHNADAAMYRAKALGKAQWEVFTADMHSNASAQLQLEVDLRRAIERQEFQLHYQPIFHLETAAIVGFEALLRWHHPLRGLISPVEFIPVAEETGLILPISWWVLQEACRQLSHWQTQFPLDVPLFISVNFSSKQFSEVGLISQIEAILQTTGLAPQSLKLEITESAIMENAEATAAQLLEIKALGIQLGIDDFGTGYSSLSYLHRFPVDILKIDRSFVSAMDSHENLQIVHTITMLSQNLGMRAVAEGVETAEQAAQLRAMNCQYAQGYFFSKPIDASSMENLLAHHYQSSSEDTSSLPLARLKLRVNAAYSYRPLVGKTSWMIGTSQSCDILLAEPNVAPKHAMFQLMGTGNYYLVNLATHVGVVVNGQLITRPTLLQEGDRITIGTTTLTFESEDLSLGHLGTSKSEKTVMMSQSLQFQGEIWQAALTSQGVSVTWQTAEQDVRQTLTQMQKMGYAIPDLLLIDKHLVLAELEDFCLWCAEYHPHLKLIFTNGEQPQVAPSEHQRVIDHGAVDLLPGFSEHNVLLNLVDTLTKINIVLQSIESQPLDRKALIAGLMPLQNIVKQGVFQ
ncbi:EAL domain-containing protein [Acaryochloris marina NIES-2412]|uniref:EAL domain-containing protein n=1 Tax=Acaryochloris marina TaxID=155978 RepID=UPI0040591F07